MREKAQAQLDDPFPIVRNFRPAGVNGVSLFRDVPVPVKSIEDLGSLFVLCASGGGDFPSFPRPCAFLELVTMLH